jgi:NADH:ubiquinone oxidoreductase subunit
MARLTLLRALSNASILLFTWRRGTPVGTDVFGNRYYKGPARRGSKRERRWVIYAGEPEATTVPPEWHAWLHHQPVAPPSESPVQRRPWMKPPLPNQTGTAHAYRPPGHQLEGGKRRPATGDYESWTPPS